MATSPPKKWGREVALGGHGDRVRKWAGEGLGLGADRDHKMPFWHYSSPRSARRESPVLIALRSVRGRDQKSDFRVDKWSGA